jgi:uncharacterized protein YjaG (DUF416 family)
MRLLRFDEKALLSSLKDLGFPRSVAFAASCCERMLPNYIAFKRQERWGDASPLQEALDLIWSCLTANRTSRSQVRRLLKAIDKVTPDTEDFETILVSSALDACTGLSRTLSCILRPDLEKVVEVATFARDTVDMYVQELEEIEPNAADLEARVLRHPLLQRELRKQQHDLIQLRAMSILTTDNTSQLRRSSLHSGKSNIDL